MLKPFFAPGAGNRYDVSTHRRRHGRQQATGYTSAAVYENRFASLYIKRRTKNLMSCEGGHTEGTGRSTSWTRPPISRIPAPFTQSPPPLTLAIAKSGRRGGIHGARSVRGVSGNSRNLPCSPLRGLPTILTTTPEDVCDSGDTQRTIR